MTAHDILLLFNASDFTYRKNVDGIDQAESLRAPEPGGNCINWVAGHLLHTRQQMLTTALSEPVISLAELTIYDSTEKFDPAQALAIEQIHTLMADSLARFTHAVQSLSREQLDERMPRPFLGQRVSRGDMLGLFNFHESYHTGQIGVLRRLLGKPGQIALRKR